MTIFFFELISFIKKQMQKNKQQNQKSSEKYIDCIKSRQKIRKFECCCNRSYSSYSSLSVHIRNKHDNDRSYLQKYLQSKDEEAMRGRPKKVQQKSINTQMKELSILELHTLELYEELSQMSLEEIILEGDESLSLVKVTHYYFKLMDTLFEKDKPPETPEQDAYKSMHTQIFKFYQKFSKQFVPQISSRILFTVKCLNKIYAKGEKIIVDIAQIQLNQYLEKQKKDLRAVWFDNQQIAKTINSALRQYLIFHKQNSES